MTELTAQLIFIVFYLGFGVATYRVFLKLTWLSNDCKGDICDFVERWFVRASVVICWPVALLFMAD